MDFDLDRTTDSDLQESCGLFGCIASGDWPTKKINVAHMTYLGLIAVQHRGQESCGISSSQGGDTIISRKVPGLVGGAFTEDDLAKLKGNLAIGHTRYSTRGGSSLANIQPFVVHTKHGQLSVAHNGQLVNTAELRQEINDCGVGLSTESDSELIVQFLCMPPPPPITEKDGANWPARIMNFVQRSKIAYSLLIMNKDKIYAVRDPFGNRPLCLGKLASSNESLIRELTQINGHDSAENCNGNVPAVIDDDCDGYVVSSESCAFPCVGAKFIREVQPGEIVEISKQGLKSICIVNRPDDRRVPAFCIFEYVYFARADSKMEGQMVFTARKECGKMLARQAPVEADIVSAVPETAIPAALGYAEESKLPYTEVLCKNRYVGRTFIQPTARLRKLAVLKKFGPLTDNFKGKRIVLIDDSIVRGNTMAAIIKILREAGAVEIHIRIASPPIRHPCYMGINIDSKEELIANKLNADELAAQVGADSLVYLTIENLLSGVQKNIKSNGKPVGHCTACLTGKYPVELEW